METLGCVSSGRADYRRALAYFQEPTYPAGRGARGGPPGPAQLGHPPPYLGQQLALFQASERLLLAPFPAAPLYFSAAAPISSPFPPQVEGRGGDLPGNMIRRQLLPARASSQGCGDVREDGQGDWTGGPRVWTGGETRLQLRTGRGTVTTKPWKVREIAKRRRRQQVAPQPVQIWDFFHCRSP